jgi:drug/metabolite transporter (DMT)-like permease
MHASIDSVSFFISALLFYSGIVAVLLLLAANIFIAAYLAVNRRWVGFKSLLKVGFLSLFIAVLSAFIYIFFVLYGVNNDASAYETFAFSGLIGLVTIILVALILKSLIQLSKQSK